MIVGGGVVLAASYEARAYGGRGAMGGARARRLCPHAVVVKPRFSSYLGASKAVLEGFRGAAPGGAARAGGLCALGVVVKPRSSPYLEASKAVFEVFRGPAPAVEGLSIEE